MRSGCWRKSVFLVRALAGGIVVLAAGLPASASAVPLISYVFSDGPWGGDRKADITGASQCLPVSDHYFDAVVPDKLPSAIRRLSHTPVTPLGDLEAAALLGIGVSSSGSVASSFFARAIERMNKTRSDALDHQIGSWSLADQQDLEAMNALVSGPRIKGLHPYLARALAKAPLRSGFAIWICGDSVEVITEFSLPAPNAIALMPDRAAIVLFLDHAPRTVWLGWGGNAGGAP